MSSSIPYSLDSATVRAKLEDLTDTNIINVQDEQIIEYDTTTNKWVNTDNTSGGGGGGGNTLTSLTDVQIFGVPANGQILSFDVDEDKWININNPIQNIDNLQDVNTAGKEPGRILTYNGSAWVSGVAFSNGRIRIGQGAGGTNASASIAIGLNAGQTGQQETTTAIGQEAGKENQEIYSVAVGINAGRISQKTGATAVGYNAGNNTQGTYSTAFGFNAGSNNQGQYSVAVGHKAGLSDLGDYSIAIGNDCSCTANNSIIINATSNTFNKTTTGMYIAPGTIQQATESEATSDNILYYDATGGKVHYRKFQTFNVYSGIDPLVNNTTGISIVRNTALDGRYIIDYSGYGFQGEYPVIQLTPYMFDETISPVIIRQVTISYFHDINNQTITVHIGSGSEFRNEFHFSFSLTSLGKLRFHGVAGGLGDNDGNDVIKEIVSITY